MMKDRIKQCKETQSYAKNLPETLTAVFDQQIEHREEVAVGTAVAIERRRSKCSSRVWSSYPLPFFFFGHQRSGYETKKRMDVLLNTDIEAPRWLKGSESTLISPHFFFFFATPPPPPKGERGQQAEHRA